MTELKPYPKYKDSGVEWIGSLPKSWNISKLKYISTIITGNTPSKTKDEYYKNGIIPWLKPDNLQDDYTISEPKEKLSEKGLKQARLIPPNSALVCCIGSIGKVAINNHHVTTNQQINSIVFSEKEKVDKKYGLYLSIAMKQEFIRQSNTVVVSILNKFNQENIKAPLPNLQTQKLISNFLDRKSEQIDYLITKKHSLIKLLEEKRQAIITETVTKGLDSNVKMKDSGIKWIREIPNHWDVRALKRTASIELSNVDKHSKDNETPVYLCNYVDVYYNNVISRDLDFMKATATVGEINKFQLKQGDVIITKDSEDPNDIAVPAWVSETMENVLCGYHLAQIRPKASLNGRFLLYQLLSRRIQEQFHSLAYGVTRYGILKGDIENGLFTLPPIEEQIDIVNFLVEIDNRIMEIVQKIDNQIIKLKEYRESLIFEAVTGKIDLRNYKEDSFVDDYDQVAESMAGYEDLSLF